MTHPADMVQYPRRRDIRTGSADPVPPTGMIPIVPLVETPAGDPLPTRRELRTGMIQRVPPAAQPAGARKAAPDPAPARQPGRRARRSRRWLWTAPAAVVVVALVLVWLQYS
ncbi:hypothetical protein LVY72_01195 [Arthrobacter sp. I2-34]|uniref:Serine/threonine protein kinase n=1 Tax=Arthrobacter hankyongi TaxID=2904801 RepID=A0ABS9L1S9_9MICC|nr:hypothetical protein [Arthrobacter hankyongi]MCG2620523.1 hypothetical protein [Arthrobacter hankyongi]